MAGRIYVANKTAVITLDGSQYVIHKGVTRVREGHELMKGREDMFVPIDCHYEVEEARAKPGRPRKSEPETEPKSEPKVYKPQPPPLPSKKSESE